MNASDALQRFGDLPFTLELEVGSLTMTVGEVFRLQEGSVLQTGHPAGLPFTLLAGGVKLAEAELFVMGDSVSARIKKMSQIPAAATGADGAS